MNMADQIVRLYYMMVDGQKIKLICLKSLSLDLIVVEIQ